MAAQSSRDAADASRASRTSRIDNVIIPSVHRSKRWNVEIKDGSPSSLVSSSTCSSEPPSLLLPPLCHPHIHLDKPYILTSNRDSSNQHPGYLDLEPVSGQFDEALENTAAAKARYTRHDLYLRGSQLIAEGYTRHGVTCMRAFVEVDHVVRFQTLEAAVRLKQDLGHLVDVQICVFAQDPIFSSEHGEENRSLVVEALDRFEDAVEALGTTPYVEKNPEASTQNIEWAVDTAMARGLHLDFHLDYTLDKKSPSSVPKVLAYLRRRHWATRAQPGKTIVIGHCTHMTTSNGTLAEVAALLHQQPELPVHFVGLPTSDVYMMGRPGAQSCQLNGKQVSYKPYDRPRGTMQIPSMIRDFGLNGCLGVNNVGNAFTPYGDGDPMQLACWGTGLYQAGTAADAEILYDCVSDRARRAIGRRDVGGSVVADDGGVGDDIKKVPVPGLLVRNRKEIVMSGRDGKELRVPARWRLSVKDVVWDPPDSSLREVVG
ncbi:hypothetical protein BD289DRAFT_362528 [Coniella lustricola]|uniref:Amidohydrolase-related domain-containing protein n=1 Tax=Coniella lustricola TaxID=2025994 RepID=A0A2T3AGG2_9PEZI|nr:hypothetical protein BD289DRAFT_362528 [Coniella lustricola]